jgi:Flp pilus assembly pilin Flp
MSTVISALYANIIWPMRDRLSREDGLEAVEYALVAALLSVVIIAAVGLLGTGAAGDGALGGLFDGIATLLENNTPGAGGTP